MENLFDNRRFADKVRRELAKRGLTQLQLCATLQISEATLSYCLCGHAPNVENYLRLLKWLDPLGFAGLYADGELK